MSYLETVTALFSLLETANLADSDKSADWQESNDACGGSLYYGTLRDAIINIAGMAIVNHWAETNEIDLSLANRI